MRYIGARELEVGSFDGAGVVEHDGVGFLEISSMFVIQDYILFGTIPFDRVCLMHD